jgi:arylsulfatase A-like enzyme
VLAGSGAAGVFLYLHLLYPHLPYEAPAGYHGLFGPGERAEVRGNREGLLNLYDAQIRLSDDVVAALMDLFDRLKLGDDLVVAIVSDHGESFWDHDRFAHGNSLYNELLHVPLIFHGPGRIPKGNVVEGIVQVMDIGATLLDLAGLPQPSDKRGASLLPAMNGGATPRLSAFSEFPYRRIPSGQTIQTRDAKWIIDQRSAEAHRFDLTTDPAEMKPNATIRADVESLLSTALAEIQSSAEKHRASAGKAKTETVSDETESQLRALGYTE